MDRRDQEPLGRCGSLRATKLSGGARVAALASRSDCPGPRRIFSKPLSAARPAADPRWDRLETLCREVWIEPAKKESLRDLREGYLQKINILESIGSYLNCQYRFVSLELPWNCQSF